MVLPYTALETDLERQPGGLRTEPELVGSWSTPRGKVCCPCASCGQRSQVPLHALSSQLWPEKTALDGPKLEDSCQLSRSCIHYSRALPRSLRAACHSQWLDPSWDPNGCHCSAFSHPGMSTPQWPRLFSAMQTMVSPHHRALSREQWPYQDPEPLAPLPRPFFRPWIICCIPLTGSTQLSALEPRLPPGSSHVVCSPR